MTSLEAAHVCMQASHCPGVADVQLIGSEVAHFWCALVNRMGTKHYELMLSLTDWDTYRDREFPDAKLPSLLPSP